jgi:hypothetical protein
VFASAYAATGLSRPTECMGWQILRPVDIVALYGFGEVVNEVAEFQGGPPYGEYFRRTFRKYTIHAGTTEKGETA